MPDNPVFLGVPYHPVAVSFDITVWHIQTATNAGVGVQYCGDFDAPLRHVVKRIEAIRALSAFGLNGWKDYQSEFTLVSWCTQQRGIPEKGFAFLHQIGRAH